VSYFAITLHSFMSGSDSSLPSVMVLYVVTFLITMFLIVYWLIMAAQKKLEKQAALKARLEKEKKTPMRPQQLSKPVHTNPYVPKNKNYSK
jgi:cell division protein FtsX